MTTPMSIAVVGHTNAGKTSLLRTLVRRRDFGQVSAMPGTTRHVETIDLVVDGRSEVRFSDTPGLEDPIPLLQLVQEVRLPPQVAASPAERIRAVLRHPDADHRFEQEAKVLRALQSADAALYVIDAREAVLPKHHAELTLLAATGKPVMPVLNQLRHPQSRPHEWQAALADHGLHAQAAFDAVAPFHGSEVRLYRDLGTLLGTQRARLDAVAASLERQQQARTRAGLRVIAEHLVALAALRRTLPREVLDDEAAKGQALREMQLRVARQAREAADAVLQANDFLPEDALADALPALSSRWEDDLFNPEVLQRAARQLGTGAAIGAALGLGLDAMFAGLSLGAATALGATLGGAASQGLGVVGRTLLNKARGQQDVTLDDDALLVLATRLLALQAALARRGHAAVDTLRLGTEVELSEGSPLLEVIAALSPARGHPEWAEGERRDERSRRQRDSLCDALLPVLHAALETETA